MKTRECYQDEFLSSDDCPGNSVQVEPCNLMECELESDSGTTEISPILTSTESGEVKHKVKNIEIELYDKIFVLFFTWKKVGNQPYQSEIFGWHKKMFEVEQDDKTGMPLPKKPNQNYQIISIFYMR